MNATVAWVSLTNPETGFAFASTHSIGFGGQWKWISEATANEIGCDADDLHCSDDIDGREFVTLRGEPVAEIHHYVRSAAGTAREMA